MNQNQPDSGIPFRFNQTGKCTRASAVRLREDYSAAALRTLARRSKTVNQSRLLCRWLRSGTVWTGARRKIGGMDRHALRDWVHRFNPAGPGGLVDNWTAGPKPRWSEEQRAQFAQIVAAGPDREKDGVVRRRRLDPLDLKRVIAGRFGVDSHPRYVGKLLKNSASPTSVRGPVIQLKTSGPSRLSKKLLARAEGSCRRPARDDAGRNLV